VATSPQETFDLFTNLDRMHEWVGGVTAVTDVTGPVDQIGTRYTTWFGNMSSPTVVIDRGRATPVPDELWQPPSARRGPGDVRTRR